MLGLDRFPVDRMPQMFLQNGIGVDTLIGGPGNDLLQGGSGADVFRFNAALDALGNLDSIADFVPGVDQVQLENAVFRALTATGALDPTLFAAVSGGGAPTAGVRVVYDTGNGLLSYDPDGNGPLAAIAFVQLSGAPALTAGDLQVI